MSAMLNMLRDNVGTILSVVVGGLITWLVSWVYYKRAGNELRDEAASLRAATNAILYIQQNPGAKVEVQRDGKGDIAGLLVNIEGHATVSFIARGSLTDANGP